MGGTIKPGGDNIIIRHITVAPGYGCKTFFEPGKGPPKKGDTPDSYSYDAFDISGRGVMIDHCTTVYAHRRDDLVQRARRQPHDPVLHHRAGPELSAGRRRGQGVHYTGHALGSLLQAGTNAKISVHHNLYAHLKGRLPRVGSEKAPARTTISATTSSTTGSAPPAPARRVNRASTISSPTSTSSVPAGITHRTARRPRFANLPAAHSSSTATTPPTRTCSRPRTRRTPMPTATPATPGSRMRPRSEFRLRRVTVAPAEFKQVPYHGVTDTMAFVFERVLNEAGARPWDRSDMDKRIVNETRTGRGHIVAWADDPFDNNPQRRHRVAVARQPQADSRPADFDTDSDGMPDAWEIAHKLDPKTPDNNADADGDGYTNLENYLHDLSAAAAR
jgi:hypothetical protein